MSEQSGTAGPDGRDRRTVRSAEASLDASSRGTGEPLLIIRTALDSEELEPLTTQPELAGRFAILTYDRRGYGASTASPGHGSIPRDATDALAVLEAFGVASAHVLGASFSAAVALELAATAPSRVRSLTLIEPPPVATSATDRFRTASEELLALARTEGTTAALAVFMPQFAGPDWRAEHKRRQPGAVERLERDAAAFFGIDTPALLAWQIVPDRFRGVTCPVLSIAGSDSGPLFSEVPGRIRGLLPQARSVAIEGAGHDVARTHDGTVAAAVATFLSRRATS